MVFDYKPNARVKCPAQVAGEICQQLEESGGLTPKRLLDASRDMSAPLHNEFEWDDAAAAENYREVQAAHIIRCIIVKPEEADKPTVRAFFNVIGEAKEYRSLDAIISTPTMRDALLDQARKEMLSFKGKYETLCELAPVFSAIDGVVGKKAQYGETA